MASSDSSGALEHNALGLVQSTVIGVAGTAPAYSIAATTAALIGSVGLLAPASLLYCGLIMLGITLAYVNLNRIEADAGATYAWVSLIFNDTLGFFSGWTVLVASALFMVSATLPAASATVLLLAPDQIDNRLLVTLVALGWLMRVSVVLIRGIAITGVVQTTMTTIELGVLAIVGGTAAWKFGPAALHQLTWASFSLIQFDLSTFARGAVISLFFFWGWDVVLNLNEETRDGTRTPGLGAICAMIIIMVSFVGFCSVALSALSDEEISQSSTNVIFAIADKLFPRPWSYLAIVAVMLSTIGTLETSILQFSRTLFSKSRAQVMHRRWSQLHPSWKTPWAGTLLIAVLGGLLLVLSLLFDSLDAVLKASIQAISVQAAYYYGIAGFACAWHYRHALTQSVSRSLFAVIWPAASALVLWSAAIVNLQDVDGVTGVIAVGGILLGALPLGLLRWRQRAAG